MLFTLFCERCIFYLSLAGTLQIVVQLCAALARYSNKQTASSYGECDGYMHSYL